MERPPSDDVSVRSLSLSRSILEFCVLDGAREVLLVVGSADGVKGTRADKEGALRRNLLQGKSLETTQAVTYR